MSRMAADGAPAFSDLADDALCCILSFLTPGDISACSCVNKRLRDLCKQELKVWMAMCKRRWGKLTDLSQWGNGRPSFRLLYGTLCRWEKLIGFWRGVGNGGWGSLTLFDWGQDHITGQKIIPIAASCYRVRKVPFMWLGISFQQDPVCLIDPSFKSIGRVDDYDGDSEGALAASSRLDCFSYLNFDVEKGIQFGFVPVDLHFVGDHHIVVEEMQHSQPAFSKNLPAEAAFLASFGLGCNLTEMPSQISCLSNSEEMVASNAGSFHYEMYQFLTRKVASPGGFRAAWKQRKKEKERATNKRRHLTEPEHFVKVTCCCPTEGRPLQGLWKGFFDSGLDFILISYDDYGGVICRSIRELSGVPVSGSILWTSLLKSHIQTPLPPAEETLYNSRVHIRPMPTGCSTEGKSGDHLRVLLEPSELVGEEVVGIFPTTSCYFDHRLSSNKREGRIWQYASGNFGFGYLHTDSVVDFRHLCSTDHALIVD